MKCNGGPIERLYCIYVQYVEYHDPQEIVNYPKMLVLTMRTLQKDDLSKRQNGRFLGRFHVLVNSWRIGTMGGEGIRTCDPWNPNGLNNIQDVTVYKLYSTYTDVPQLSRNRANRAPHSALHLMSYSTMRSSLCRTTRVGKKENIDLERKKEKKRKVGGI